MLILHKLTINSLIIIFDNSLTQVHIVNIQTEVCASKLKTLSHSYGGCSLSTHNTDIDFHLD
jgi:hypothetical protein